jgi:hypothetical protein
MNVESKISTANHIIKELKGYANIKYVLSDSWYSAESVINTTIDAYYTYIGAIKNNRIIYPSSEKDGIQIKHYIKGLKKKSFDLVTVKGKKYYAFRYCGKINRVDNVVIIITYPKGEFRKPNALKTFVCSDTSMSTYEILHVYSRIWRIESFIRDCKRYLGLKGYQIRNYKGIKRFLVVIILSYSYIACRNKKYCFSKNIKVAQKNVQHNIIEHIYNLCANNTELKDIIKCLCA